jgi:hypothetical protein
MKLPRLDGSILHSKVLQGVLLFFAVATSFVILLHMPLVRVASSDLFLYFRPAARAWLFGGEPYGIHGYVNPPWTLPLMVPFSLGPPRLGYVLFFLFSCAVVAAAVRAFGGRAWTLLAVLIAPPTVALLALGQVDIWVLLGVILGRWAADEEHWAGLGLALALLLIKPQIGALMALTWILTLPKRLTWKALVALGVVWFLSCLTVGTWWPFEVNFTRELDGSYRRSTLSTLSAVRGLGLPSFVYAVLVAGLLGLWGWEIRVQRSSDYLIALSLLVGSLCSPFILLHSFSVSLAVAFVYVASRSWLWAVPCYVLTWVPILTLWVDDWQSWWGAGTWWVLLVALLVVRRHLAEE